MAESKSKITWKTVRRKLSELKPYEKNPRDLTEQGLKDLDKSISKFGLAEPIVINTDNVICGGHGRYVTLKQQGVKECDCYMPSRKLSPKEFEELNIRLNKNQAGVFNFDILANEFEMEDLLSWGFDKIELGMIDEVAFPELKDGDREPFQQITFTLADQQAQIIQQCLKDARAKEDFNYCETYQNENSNGNALYFIVSQWLTLSK